jgi:hypothetical protein
MPIATERKLLTCNFTCKNFGLHVFRHSSNGSLLLCCSFPASELRGVDKHGGQRLLAARRGNSRFQNGSCGGKDVRRVVVGNFFFCFQPVLDVAPTELCPVESQCFATDERDGFRFRLAQMAERVFAVHKLFGGGVPENHMGDFVERGFVRERG